MSAQLVLFDDARARRWAPFASTRPVGELLYGTSRLRERVERVFEMPCALHLCGPTLVGWDEPDAPPVGSLDGTDPASDATGPARDRVVWSSRAVVDERPDAGVAATFVVEGHVAGWSVPAGDAMPPSTALAEPETYTPGARVEVPGEWLDWPWTLVSRNAARLTRDLLDPAYADAGAPTGVIRIGGGALSLAADSEIEPGVVVDTTAGPVRLEAGVRVRGPARLTGPLYLAPDCQVFGGSLSTVSAGPGCKLRGEIDSSVLLGFVNKAHDGYLGHALLGRWVNLGALTTNSDLKNTYSSVRVELPDGIEDTGLLKVGVFLGDHVKTGIGTLLTTGAVVGAGTNLFGGGTPPRAVAAFSWGGADGLVPYRFDRFVATAELALSRRNHVLTPGSRAVLERAWHQAHGP
jgi:UDP-N-acetylglucosamine diphosphorylase/glucosamine-1-phosphate N-acetyltransferase